MDGRISSMIEVPVAALTGDYKKLLDSLTVANPEYKNASFFGRGRVSKNIPKQIFFYELNTAKKSIFVPRNIDFKYFKYGTRFSITTSNGDDIQSGIVKGFTFRPDQRKYFDNIVYPYLHNNTNKGYIDILLNCPCGSGKTIMSLFLSEVYKKKTLVAVTRKRIGEQFITACKKFFPGWTVGWYNGDKPDVTYDITISTYSLLSQEKYTTKFYDQFGHLIMDEYHRVGADSYNKVVERAACKYRTSLTATFRRKDGLHKILALHTGEILTMDVLTLPADIYPVETGAEIQEEEFRSVGRWYTLLRNLDPFADVAVFKNRKEVDRGCIVSTNVKTGEFTLKSTRTFKDIVYNTNDNIELKELGTVAITEIDTEVAQLADRNDLVLRLIKWSLSKGRTPIVLSKRKEFLFSMAKRLRRYGIKVGVIVSEKDKEYKQYVKGLGYKDVEEYVEWCFEECAVLLGINQLAEEGMDMPRADTLIYVHPVNDIEQSIGRITREYEGKQKPMAFFLLDKVNSYQRAFYDSKKGAELMFKQLGHTVHDKLTSHDTNFL